MGDTVLAGRPRSWKLNQKMALLHHGTCARCHTQIHAPRQDSDPPNIAIFSGANRQDPLYPLLGKDHGAYLATLQYLLDNMNPLESTLIALNHMQVSVCHLRTRGGKYQGLTAYRKNIISFPQELVEMTNLQQFFDTLEVNDFVNVVMDSRTKARRRMARERRR